ncbi:MAG: hypothetical protein ACT4PO_04805 [Actinomycetota bacterium]
MSDELRSAGRWWGELRAAIRAPDLAPQLQAAADGACLRPWTELLTLAVVRACGAVGWVCAAKQAGANPLPISRAEYLGIDVLAFAPGRGWRRPVAAFELENSGRDDVVAYALWKACTLAVDLACLLCYRRRPEEIGALVRMLQDDVLRRVKPQAEVVVAVGTRSAADTFPDGYFRPFGWDSGKAALTTMVGAG